MRERLIELIQKSVNGCARNWAETIADYLLENGVIVTPCVAMVEQFIKDGKFDEKLTAHNGRYAVVYIDKSKWNCPLIDITEQRYKAEKAEERIQALKTSVERRCTGMKFTELKECPCCGNDEFYTTAYVYGSIVCAERFDGKETDNAELYDGLNTKNYNGRAYCRMCNKYLGNKETGSVSKQVEQALKGGARE